MTNNHVVAGATSIKVTVAGRSETYTADVVGVDPSADIALIQVRNISGLPTVQVADSATVKVGQAVVAIGNALGRGGTPSVTQGHVTALDQTITASDGGSAQRLSGLIETDASISPGDSGGALLNAAGQVIGMIAAADVSGSRRTASTVAYIIPSSTALGIVNQVRAGNAGSDIIMGQPGYIGVSVADLTSRNAQGLGLDPTGGVLVEGVQPGSPAARAGISQGAVITAIAGTPVSSTDALGSAIHKHKPGERIQVTWTDTSGNHTATMQLISGPAV